MNRYVDKGKMSEGSSAYRAREDSPVEEREKKKRHLKEREKTDRWKSTTDRQIDMQTVGMILASKREQRLMEFLQKTNTMTYTAL